ncbi:MAG: ATP-dependent helicase, partial [Lachnospiraceae bacterium]
YILVDEFQDINGIQYEIIKMLAGDNKNLFVVGDDDQSIYGFRGARPDIMLNFQKDYPDAEKILLNYNYRSTKQIVEGAAMVINSNEKRFKKVIKDSGREGQPIIFNEFNTMDDENDFVLNKIRQLHDKQNVAYDQIAVIARTNVGLRPVMGKLIEYNIPFTTRESIPNLFEHWIAKDIFAYIRLAQGSTRRSDFLRVMNKPKRYISRDMLYGEEINFSVLLSMTGDRVWLYDKINDFRQSLEYIKRLNPFAAVNYICKGVGYNDYLKEYAGERRISEEELMGIVGEILESTRNFNNYGEWFQYIEEYNEKLKEQAKHLKEKKDAVSLCTMHASKGLEYKAVIIVDANEGVTPYHKAVLEPEIEEERRMFYVAMTRARDQLYICASRQRFNKTQEVSRFVKNLAKNP